MACDAQTLLSAAAANGLYGLEDRALNLCLCGFLSTAQGNLSASAVLASGRLYQNLTEQQLDDAVAAHLCELVP